MTATKGSGEVAVMSTIGQRARTYLGILAAALLLLAVGAFAGAPARAGGPRPATYPGSPGLVARITCAPSASTCSTCQSWPCNSVLTCAVRAESRGSTGRRDSRRVLLQKH